MFLNLNYNTNLNMNIINFQSIKLRIVSRKLFYSQKHIFKFSNNSYWNNKIIIMIKAFELFKKNGFYVPNTQTYSIILWIKRTCLFMLVFTVKRFGQYIHLNCGSIPHSYVKCLFKLDLRFFPV